MASIVQTKEYTATASLLFRDPQLDVKLFGNSFLAPSADPTRQAATNLEMVSLETVSARTARALGNGLTPDDVQSKVSVESAGASDIAKINATDQSPPFAARLANTFGREYIAFRREGDRLKISQATALVSAEAGQLEQNGVSSSDPRLRSLRSRGIQLQVLSSLQTGNAELVQRALVPTHPSSPLPVRNAIVAAVLTLLLGSAFALLHSRFDRRFKEVSDVDHATAAPILAAVPFSNTLAQPGATTQTESPDLEAFRMLRARLRYLNVDRPIRSMLVTSPAPGDGKSTIAWNIAITSANMGSRVVLVEADLRRPVLSVRYGLDPSKGLSEVLTEQVSLGEVLSLVPFTEARGNLAILAAGTLPPNPSALLDSDRMVELLEQLEADYDLVVVDSAPLTAVSDAIPLVRQASGVMIVCRLGTTTHDGLSRLEQSVEEIGGSVLGIVVNGVRRQRDDYYGYGAYDQRPDTPTPSSSVNSPGADPHPE